MRRVFLWAARNRWLKERLPRLGFMRRAVRRFMPGETMESALTAAEPLQAAGIATMYTRLGENLESLAEADEVVAHYIELIDRITAAGIDGEVSVKPTQLGLDEDPEVCLVAPRPARRARRGRRLVSVDRHGGERLHRRDHRPLRAPAGDAAEDGDLPPVVPAAHGRRHHAAAPARPGDPPRQGRLRRARVDRLPRQARRGLELRRAGRAVPARGSRPADPARASARTTSGSSSRSPRWSARRASGATGSRSRCSTASARTSSSAWRRRAIGSRRSSPTASTGTRGTCAAWPNARPTSGSRCGRCCRRGSRRGEYASALAAAPRSDGRVRCRRAGSSAVEHGTFNPLVVGSNPTRLARACPPDVVRAGR